MNMDKSSKKNYIWIVMLLIAVVFGLLFWAMKGEEKVESIELPTNVSVSIKAESTWVPLMGSVELTAEVSPKEIAENPALDFSWSCKEGSIIGSGAKAVWTAPRAVGVIKVSLKAFIKGDPDKDIGSDSIEIRAVNLEEKVQESAGQVDLDLKKNTKTAAGYEIKSIKFDKEEICDTDDVRVTIDATDPLGKSDWIQAVVKFPGTKVVRGSDVIGRVSMLISKSEFKKPSPIEVTIFDMRFPGQPVARTKVSYPIIECDKETNHSKLYVDCYQKNSGTFEMSCQARHVDEDFEWYKGQVRHYEWWIEGLNAPDLPEITTSKNWEYPIPETWVVDKIVHTWIVHAKATLINGRVLKGRGTFSLIDYRYFDKAVIKKLAVQVVNGVGRIEGEHVITPMRTRNPFPEDMVIESVEISKGNCVEHKPRPKVPKDSDEIPPRREQPKKIAVGSISPNSFFGTNRLVSGQWVDFEWKVPFEDGMCSYGASLKGFGVDSRLPIRGVFGVSTDPSQKRALTHPVAVRQRDADQILTKERKRTVHFSSAYEVNRLVEEGKLRPMEEYMAEWRAKQPPRERRPRPQSKSKSE
jgi:hypothetical protein